MKMSRPAAFFGVCALLAACNGEARVGGPGLPATNVPFAQPAPAVRRATQKALPYIRASGWAGKLVEFDDPSAGRAAGSSCGAFCGTVPLANGRDDTVVGAYSDSTLALHAFVRDLGNSFKNFEAPGAGSAPGEGTIAYSINDGDWIAGVYQDPNLRNHGFLRNPNGSIKTFEEPQAGAGKNQGTEAFSLNNRNETAGNYIDSSGRQHGFVRSPDGAFQSFDPKGSTFTFVCEETCLNDVGDVTGVYCDSSNALHGFIRYHHGTIETIDAHDEGADCNSFVGTVPASINARGVIAGYYIDRTNYAHAFVRESNGALTYFTVPHGKAVGPCAYTVAFSINDDGTTAGVLGDSTGAWIGFSRSHTGELSKFKAPGAGTGYCSGTRVSTNNARGGITGWWTDADGLDHGFLWTPDPS